MQQHHLERKQRSSRGMLSGMEFDCKLAHRDGIVKISGFSSTKELYEKISLTFSISISKILYCTLNTHNFRDTDALLGNYLSLGDMIVVHLCGDSKESNFKKTQEYLGLTITDNGIGRAFVKKVNSNDKQFEQLVKPGDHIAAVNNDSTVGMRHFEVAKTIRDIPQMTSFTLHLIEPLYNEKYLIENPNDENRLDHRIDTVNAPSSRLRDHDSKGPARSFKDMNSYQIENFYLENEISDSLSEDLANSSLPIDRLLSKGVDNQKSDLITDVSTSKDSYRIKIEKINSILESFLGINDNTLAIQLYRLARENEDSQTKFSEAIRNSELGVFNFDGEIESYLWKCTKSDD